jgi:hypothetical protein
VPVSAEDLMKSASENVPVKIGPSALFFCASGGQSVGNADSDSAEDQNLKF